VNPTIISETIRKEDGRIARLMCHTKLMMTPEEYTYHQFHLANTFNNKRKISYAFDKIIQGPEADMKASYDSYVAKFEGPILKSEYKAVVLISE